MKMKKVALLIGSLIITAILMAQDGAAPLSKGGKQLNFGLGFSGRGIPAYIGMDFAFHNDWTAGPVLKVVIDEDPAFGALGRVDYHWNRLIGIPSNWDFYLGASLGVLSGDDVDLDLGLQIGGRWYWNNKWGLNLEFGGGTGYGSSLGLSMKL
jgi:outer membrane immunogenic protein